MMPPNQMSTAELFAAFRLAIEALKGLPDKCTVGEWIENIQRLGGDPILVSRAVLVVCIVMPTAMLNYLKADLNEVQHDNPNPTQSL